jgi:hypothetical protein
LLKNTAATIQTNYASALPKSSPPVVVWISFQEQDMNEDATSNVQSAHQAAATKRSE